MPQCQIILHTLKDLRIDQSAFDLMKEEKLKALENETHFSPVYQARCELNWILQSGGSTFDQRKEVLNCRSLNNHSTNKSAMGVLTK